MFEQPLPHLEADHTAGGVIDQLQRHLAGFDKLGEVCCVRAGDHVDVHAGGDRLGSGVPQIGGNTLVDQLTHAVPVGNDDTVKAPLVLEHLSEQPAMSVHGHAVDAVSYTHM